MQRIRPVLNRICRRRNAAVALILGLASGPSFAAAGINPLCDEDQTLPAPPEELTIDTVDHVPIIDAAATRLGIVDQSPPALASTTPRVDRILRQIFDEAPPDDASGGSVARSTAAPLVELTTPDLIDDVSDALRPEPQESQEGELPAPLVDPRFPGLSDADAERYRRQMFRTDI